MKKVLFYGLVAYLLFPSIFGTVDTIDCEVTVGGRRPSGCPDPDPDAALPPSGDWYKPPQPVPGRVPRPAG